MRITLVGRVANTPIWTPPYTRTTDGKEIGSKWSCSMAENDKNGKTTYRWVSAWRGLADMLAQNMTVGRLMVFFCKETRARVLERFANGQPIMDTAVTGREVDINNTKMAIGTSFQRWSERVNLDIDTFEFGDHGAKQVAADVQLAASRGITVDALHAERRAVHHLPWDGTSQVFGFAKVSLPRTGTVIPHTRRDKVNVGQILTGGAPNMALGTMAAAGAATPAAASFTYEDYIKAQWNDALLQQHGLGHLIPARVPAAPVTAVAPPPAAPVAPWAAVAGV